MVVDACDTGVLLHLFLVNVASLRHEEEKLFPTVDASIKMTISGYSREGSGINSRSWLMLVTREFSYISFLLTLLLLGTRRKRFQEVGLFLKGPALFKKNMTHLNLLSIHLKWKSV